MCRARVFGALLLDRFCHNRAFLQPSFLAFLSVIFVSLAVYCLVITVKNVPARNILRAYGQALKGPYRPVLHLLVVMVISKVGLTLIYTVHHAAPPSSKPYLAHLWLSNDEMIRRYGTGEWYFGLNTGFRADPATYEWLAKKQKVSRLVLVGITLQSMVRHPWNWLYEKWQYFPKFFAGIPQHGVPGEYLSRPAFEALLFLALLVTGAVLALWRAKGAEQPPLEAICWVSFWLANFGMFNILHFEYRYAAVPKVFCFFWGALEVTRFIGPRLSKTLPQLRHRSVA